MGDEKDRKSGYALAVQHGLSKKRVAWLMRKHNLSDEEMESAILISDDYPNSLGKVCETLRYYDGDCKMVNIVLSVCKSMKFGVRKTSQLLKKFEGDDPDYILTVLQEACNTAGIKWRESVISGLLEFSEKHPEIAYLDELVSEFICEKTGKYSRTIWRIDGGNYDE
ncbi:MAG: hypothetical protein CR954_00670 [Candidatus Moraniibacteriota bacterium]|nr:MAG: hypothetical protein CR954_00670 [Candidatus Moranbacteria bacterium]